MSIVCHSSRFESGACIVFELVGQLGDLQMVIASERRREGHERHSFSICFYHWSVSSGLWSREWTNQILTEVSLVHWHIRSEGVVYWH